MEEKYPIIDAHCHVLPGVDDGARNMEESMRLLELAYRQGITSVIATPHDRGDRDFLKCEELRERLQETVRKTLADFCIYPGSENYYHEELPVRLEGKRASTLAESPCVLVEFHPAVSYGTMFRGLRRLTGTGYVPVLAHMERYACLRKEEYLKELLESGCRLQMNFESLQGSRFSAEVRWCRKQVLAGRIFLMGTDMHRLDFRPPDIKQALKWMDGYMEPEMRKRLLCDNPMTLIEGGRQESQKRKS